MDVISEENAITGMIIWEEIVTRRIDNNLPAGLLQLFNEQGTAQTRADVLSMAPSFDRVWDEMGDDKDVYAFDWELVPWLLDQVDWTELSFPEDITMQADAWVVARLAESERASKPEPVPDLPDGYELRKDDEGDWWLFPPQGVAITGEPNEPWMVTDDYVTDWDWPQVRAGCLKKLAEIEQAGNAPS